MACGEDFDGFLEEFVFQDEWIIETHLVARSTDLRESCHDLVNFVPARPRIQLGGDLCGDSDSGCISVADHDDEAFALAFVKVEAQHEMRLSKVGRDFIAQ